MDRLPLLDLLSHGVIGDKMRMRALRSIAALCTLATLVLPVSANAGPCDPGDNGCQGYQRNANTYVAKVCATSVDPATGSTVTRLVIPLDQVPAGTTTGMCVYLPPGYEASGLRYPVMYLLHGGLGDQADWVDKGQIRRIMDQRYAADPTSAMIVVIPDAGWQAQWADALDGSFANETYLIDDVIPFIDATYRTIDDRSGRIVEGLSNGGFGSMLMAAKHPDLFISAGGMSSDLEQPTWWPGAPYGTPATAPAYQDGQTPRDLAMNLDDVATILNIGTGCEQDDYTRDGCWLVGLELSFVPMNRLFVQALHDAGHPDAMLSYTETTGEHAWKYWQRWLSGPQLDWHLARIQRATATPLTSARPTSWRYTSVAPKFVVWGYSFAADPARAREFLTITNASTAGLTLTGSGRVQVQTAPLYDPGASYVAGGQTIAADDEGRLSFAVDLGPAHAAEEYGPQAAAGSAADPSYMHTVTISIARA